MIYKSTKTWGHSIGLSCAFRQWRAQSHCRFIHGYALSIRVEFASRTLDVRNWVVDFGSLKSFKQQLEDTFDHKLVVAQDDPDAEVLFNLNRLSLAQVVILPAVGCEKFAEYVAGAGQTWLQANGYGDRVWISKVEVAEHGANSAIVEFEEGEVI